MSYRPPTTQELFNDFLARFEAELGQDAPLSDKAFLRVLAAIEAGLMIGLYRLGADSALQALAITATNSGLDRIGNDNSLPRKQAEACEVTATLPATTGTVIPVNTEFVAVANGLRYKTTAAATSVASVATLSLRAVTAGVAGTLDIGDTLNISAQIPAAQTQATVTVVDQIGVDQETDADYRPRVLFIQRAVTGGANATDHKIWAEAVAGVRRAFPYAGRPAYAGVSFPGDRTVYVEATTAVDADGIAPGSLLDDVRADLNTDPETGESRLVLGLTDATLWVETISRTSIFVEIRDLLVDPALDAACKADISTALDTYFRNLATYIDGVDLPQERNDTITTPSVSSVVNDVLFSYGATSQSIGFGLVVGVFVNLYFLNPGELAKLGGVTYI